MAATQFEAPNARKAFPCFDDPGMKAVFYITLGRRTTWTALANTPVQQTIPM
jgi:aminopeptidase N